MDWLRKAREDRGISQRNLALLAGVSYRTLQLAESGQWDPKISTLQSIVSALGYAPDFVERHLRDLAAENPDSIRCVTDRIAQDEASWKVWLFNFVDRFNAEPQKELIDTPPCPAASERIRALAASTVEALCRKQGWTPPDWCLGIPALREPWFPSETESLKASALIESPVDFRRRNIFVLGNFLERA